MTTTIYVAASYDDLMRHFGDEKLADACYREKLQASIADDGAATVTRKDGSTFWLDAALYRLPDEG